MNAVANDMAKSSMNSAIPASVYRIRRLDIILWMEITIVLFAVSKFEKNRVMSALIECGDFRIFEM